MKPNLDFEIQVGYPATLVAGVDEVGRGCLAGPVVAAAVIAPSTLDWSQDSWLHDIKDSKLLSPVVRARLVPLITNWALSSAVGVATVEEIDQLNIFQASHLAMIRALKGLKTQPQHILVDGKWLPKGLAAPATAIIKGDQKSLSIAAASILAKEWRDQKMLELEEEFPGYGFAQHKGYPTTQHSDAIESKGICIEHRKSFGPVKKALQLSLALSK